MTPHLAAYLDGQRAVHAASVDYRRLQADAAYRDGAEETTRALGHPARRYTWDADDDGREIEAAP